MISLNRLTPIFILFAFKFLIANSIPDVIIDKIEKSKLYYSKEWRRELHYRDGISEIDDERFFLSKNGKTDIKEELYATINRLIEDRSDNNSSTMCIYPSRSYWLLDKIPELKNYIYIPKCKELKRDIATIDAKYVSIILASAHINSPASAFGHTFLRVDSSQDTILNSYVVNYSAQTNEDNGFIYAYMGLFGGYRGLYSIDLYSKKIKTYNSLEQRDIWEYNLNLKQDEIDRLILHILEIKNFYADYFFTMENCSYNMLWILEVARPSLNLIDRFKFKAIPIDTIRAILDENLVDAIKYRPSKRKKMLALAKDIETQEAISLIKSDNFDLESLDKLGLTTTQRAKSLELAIYRLQIERADGKIDKKKYLKRFLKLLKSRSRLGRVKSEEIVEPISPDRGHNSSKLTLSMVNSSNNLQLETKISYHDIYDNESGYISGAFINFFNTKIEIKNGRVSLKRLDFLDIRSYAHQDLLFKPISWQVSTGFKRLFNNNLYGYLQTGGGITIGDDNLYGYFLISPTIYQKSSTTGSISAIYGGIYNQSKYLKFGVLNQNEFFKDRKITKFEIFSTYNINTNSAIDAKYRYEDIDKIKGVEFILSYLWYF